MIILVFIQRNSIHFWRRCVRKNDFYIFIPSDLDLWPSDLKFVSLLLLSSDMYPLIKSFYGFTVSRKSNARDGQTHRQTDGQTDGDNT